MTKIQYLSSVFLCLGNTIGYVQRLSKTLLRIGYALILLPLLVDVVNSHFDVTQFFDESRGGGALWIELFTLPLGLLFILVAILFRILSKKVRTFK